MSGRTDARSITWRETSNEWWQTQARRHELFVSDEVVAELSAPDFPHSAQALEMLRGLRLLELTPEVLGFAGIMFREKVMPSPAVSGDAIHIATATIHRMEYVLSWNVKHMANPTKRTHFAAICLRVGHVPPLIVTPDLLQEMDDEQD